MHILHKAFVIFALFSLLLETTGCQKNQTSITTVDSTTNVALNEQIYIHAISPQSRLDLHRYFLEYQYNWNTVKHGVPPLIVDKFPDDFYKLAAGSERSRTFFLTLLPMVLLVNEEIARERNSLIELFARYDRDEKLSADELEQIANSARNYKVDGDPLTDRQDRTLLLNRLDQIPPSLALAQAASESAYGTSRFSRLGNNLFGEMVFNASSEGIIPLNRPEGAKHRARIFPTLLDSLRAYILNLNTNPAYQELRQIRAEMQLRGEKVLGSELARGLRLYSTRKEAYIDDIQAIIRFNNLPKYTANATLRKDIPAQNNPGIKSLQETTDPSIPKITVQTFYGRVLLSQN